MSDVKVVAASIVNFLRQQLEGVTLSADSRESVEVGLQCIETAFDIKPEDAMMGVDLLQLIRRQALTVPNRADAERLKNEGNELMKAERFREALAKYTRAIDIDPHNAVFYCNRAAAQFKLGQHDRAVADCTTALAIQPDYSKAHGRLGLALTALDRNREARQAFARAVALEPDNESYQQNLRLADERLQQRGERGHVDLGGLLQNPALLNMATEMLADPNMQNLISGLVNSTSTPATNGQGGMSALLEAGQALAQQMQAANPDLIEQLRRQVRPPGSDNNPSGNNPPGNNPPGNTPPGNNPSGNNPPGNNQPGPQ